jgi:hypothetical protein
MRATIEVGEQEVGIETRSSCLVIVVEIGKKDIIASS